MPSQLPPKPTSRNPQQKQQRLAMLENGFPPIPVEKKGVIIPAWNTVKIDAQAIEDWDSYRKDAAGRPLGYSYRGTGFRVEGEIFVLDLDVKDADLAAHMLAAIEAVFPDYLAGSLIRHSGGNSLAIISRISEAAPGTAAGFFSTTYGKLGADGNLTDAAHFETYDGRHKGKQFQAFGPHKVEPREYGYWNGRTPANTKLASLYQFPAQERGLLHDILEAVLEKYLTPVRPAHDAHGPRAVYDLKPDTLFRVKGRGLVRCDDLEAELPIGPSGGVYGLMGDTDPKTSDSLGHCKAYRREVGVHHGRLVITDYSEDVTHHWEDEEAPELYDAEALAEALKAAGIGEDVAATSDERPKRETLADIAFGDTPQESFANAVVWMIGSLAWHAGAFKGRGGVLSIWPEAEFTEPVTLAALKGELMRYSYMQVGPRGGLRRVHPVDAWMCHPQQVRVYGARLRPELVSPLYLDPDSGLQFINRYHPPHHPTAGGSVAAFTARMAALIPDAVERAWAMNWIVCKAQHPEWRMVGLAMIARETGTGRGLLAETLALMLGRAFVSPMPYAKLSGGSGSRFNAEVVNNVLVYINESRDADDRKFSHKNAAREALKDFVEPNHRLPFRVEPKGVDAYITRAAVSTLVFTNNIDGLPISEGDRRIAVVMNGEQMTVAERDAYQAWMLVPENIGALHRHMLAHRVEADRAVFDPYMAPAFHGRDLMIDAGKTALDHAWETALALMETAADLYTMSQVVTVTKFVARTHHADFDDLVRRHTVTNGFRIGTKNGVNWLVTFPENGERERVYAFNERSRKVFSVASKQEVGMQLGMQQRLVEEPSKAFNKHLKALTGGKTDG